MKIIQSQSRFELSAVLTDAEALLYREVCRTKQPVAIPEFGNRKFIVQEITPYEGEGRAEKTWHLVIQQVSTERVH